MQPDKLAVTVVIPTFNYACFLPEAIDSALAQTVRPARILVVDDGSTDGTDTVVRGYPDVDYVHQPNRGLPSARNTGAAMVSTAYVVFLDADNLLRPEFIERCLDALAQVPQAGFAYTQLELFGGEVGVTAFPGYDFELLKRGNFIDACSLMRTELSQRFGYDESLRAGWEDWDFYLTLGEQGIGGVLVDEPLVRYRQHKAQMSQSFHRSPCAWRRLRLAVVRRHLGAFGWKEYLRTALRVAYRCGIARRAAAPDRSAIRSTSGSRLGLK